jgi:hypothetical protein
MRYFALVFLFSLPALAGDPAVHAIRTIGLPPARSDVAPENVTIVPAPVYQAPDPTNGTGANINLIPSPGERSVLVTDYTVTNLDTLTFVTVDMQGTSTTTVLTEGTAYECNGAADGAACALAIKNAIDAHATLGPATVIVCTDATCSDRKIGFHITPGYTSWMSITSSDPAGITVTSGTDGCTRVGPTSYISGTATQMLLGNTCGAQDGTFFGGNVIAGNYIKGANVFISGSGEVWSNILSPTVATMTLSSADGKSLRFHSGLFTASWTNAMVVNSCATPCAATLGNVSVATLPAKTRVKNAYLVIDSQCADTTTLTVSVGRTGAGYIDYIVASDAKVAANTVYGDAAVERGTNLTGYDLPSFTGTTTVYAQFNSTGANLSAVTSCTGHINIETELEP